MLTGIQIRSARSALKWSLKKLSRASGVSVRTINRMEVVDTVPNSNAPNLAYHVLVWKKMLVASTNFHLFFYNLKSRQFIGTLTLNSPILSITSSPSFLYVAQSSQVQIYK